MNQGGTGNSFSVHVGRGGEFHMEQYLWFSLPRNQGREKTPQFPYAIAPGKEEIA
jgi:hypothetical protein